MYFIDRLLQEVVSHILIANILLLNCGLGCPLAPALRGMASTCLLIHSRDELPGLWRLWASGSWEGAASWLSCRIPGSIDWLIHVRASTHVIKHCGNLLHCAPGTRPARLSAVGHSLEDAGRELCRARFPSTALFTYAAQAG